MSGLAPDPSPGAEPGRPAASVGFDARALSEPVERTEVRAFVQRLRAEGRMASSFSASTIIGIVVAVFIGVTFLLVFGSIVPIFLGVLFRDGDSPLWGVGAILPVLLIGGIVALVVTAIVRGLSGTQARWFRLDRFARANAMTYIPAIQRPALNGMIFGLGNSRVANDVVRGAEPRFVEFANYRYTTGSGKNRTTHAWGYVAIKLDTPLPHIVLDAQSNNGLFGSNLPASFDRDQRLSLEGDFDRYFSLYCPEGYERDALYLFTPDIMARFIDNAAALDIEIVDDWMFLYAKRDFVTLDPATWAWLFSVVAALIDKVDRWARWRDERLSAAQSAASWPPAPSLPAEGDADAAPVAAGAGPAGANPASVAFLRPPPGVAPQGRRLHRAFPWAAVIVVGAIVLFWFLVNSGVLGAVFSTFLN